MTRFLIELSHDESHATCKQMLWAFDRIGSHFVTRADWGCMDGVHKGWLVVDVPSREDALMMIPPPFRRDATVVRLNRFTRETVELMLAAQGGSPGPSELGRTGTES